MTYSGLIIIIIKKSKLRKVLLWRDLFNKDMLQDPPSIWNFKVAPHSSLLIKNFLTKRGPLLNGWTRSSLFSKIRVHFSDRQGVGEGITSGTSCISFNNHHRSTLRITISKWLQKWWSHDFLKHLLEFLEESSILDQNSIIKHISIKQLQFISDFQVKRRFQSWFHSFWTQFRRIAIFHIKQNF